MNLKLNKNDYKNIQKILKTIFKIKNKFLAGLLLIFTLLIILLCYFLNSYFTKQKNSESKIENNDPEILIENSKEYLVKRVVDGDTFEIESEGKSFKVRMIGMNTPETVKPNSPVECYGKEASTYTKDLLTGKTVILEEDVQPTDKYGRLLRYVYIKSESGELVFINKKIVEDGYAYASSYPPNIKYQEILKSTEKKAREDKSGLWAECIQDK